jgi:hypothetical protein
MLTITNQDRIFIRATLAQYEIIEGAEFEFHVLLHLNAAIGTVAKANRIKLIVD